MRLYSTSRGIGLLTGSGKAGLLGVPERDLDEVFRHSGDLAALRDTPVTEEVGFDDLEIYAPVRRPSKVLCVGANYQSHVDEMRAVLEVMQPGKADDLIARLKQKPFFFSVPPSAIAGPYDDIVLPAMAPEQVDYEIELALIMGRRARHVSVSEAWDHVAGVTLANDVSARDLQAQAMQGSELEFSHAKGLDGFKPLGPCLLTREEISQPMQLRLEARVNGEIRQSDDTGNLIHSAATCVAHISTFHTLMPGDVILTGSPAGVGFFQGKFLRPGDEVTMQCPQIGEMKNRVVSGPPAGV